MPVPVSIQMAVWLSVVLDTRSLLPPRFDRGDLVEERVGKPGGAGAGSLWPRSGRRQEVPKQKQHTVVDVTGDGSKVQCCKEQYCTGTWNVRSMNQGKLKVVKQEKARVNVDILGISELKWTGMGEFNSDDCYIYYCGQETLEEMV